MTKKSKQKSIIAIKNDKQYKGLVDNTLHEMQNMTNALVEGGMNEIDAELKVKQLYLQNMQTFSDPANAAIALMAELKTRIDLDRQLNPEKDLVSDKYVELLDQMRKTVDLLNRTKPKTINHNVQKMDDNHMKFDKFIDIEDE